MNKRRFCRNQNCRICVYFCAF